jgi:hypothetical protein
MIDYQAFVFTMDNGLITIDCLKLLQHFYSILSKKKAQN